MLLPRRHKNRSIERKKHTHARIIISAFPSTAKSSRYFCSFWRKIAKQLNPARQNQRNHTRKKNNLNTTHRRHTFYSDLSIQYCTLTSIPFSALINIRKSIERMYGFFLMIVSTSFDRASQQRTTFTRNFQFENIREKIRWSKSSFWQSPAKSVHICCLFRFFLLLINFNLFLATPFKKDIQHFFSTNKFYLHPNSDGRKKTQSYSNDKQFLSAAKVKQNTHWHLKCYESKVYLLQCKHTVQKTTNTLTEKEQKNS